MRADAIVHAAPFDTCRVGSSIVCFTASAPLTNLLIDH